MELEKIKEEMEGERRRTLAQEEGFNRKVRSLEDERRKLEDKMSNSEDKKCLTEEMKK